MHHPPDHPTDLMPEPTPPPVPGVCVVRETFDDLIGAVCADVLMQAIGCVRTFGDVHLAFEPTGRVLDVVMRLMVDPIYRQLPWASAHVWVISDGPYPPGDDRSGFADLYGYIGDHAGIPSGQLHAIGIRDPKADEDYEGELRRCLSHREPGHDRIDFALGELDEHAGFGGLVPGAIDHANGALVAACETRGQTRVSLTLGAINAARCVGVIASGAGVGAALGRVAVGQGDAAGLAPLAGEQRWYIDHAACAPAGNSQPNGDA